MQKKIPGKETADLHRWKGFASLLIGIGIAAVAAIGFGILFRPILNSPHIATAYLILMVLAEGMALTLPMILGQLCMTDEDHRARYLDSLQQIKSQIPSILEDISLLSPKDNQRDEVDKNPNDELFRKLSSYSLS